MQRPFIGLTCHQAILEILLDGENYGKAIQEEAQKRTNRALSLFPGTLYPTLHALEREGLIAMSRMTKASNGSGRPRKVYMLTEAGRETALRARRLIETFYGFSEA